MQNGKYCIYSKYWDTICVWNVVVCMENSVDPKSRSTLFSNAYLSQYWGLLK